MLFHSHDIDLSEKPIKLIATTLEIKYCIGKKKLYLTKIFKIEICVNNQKLNRSLNNSQYLYLVMEKKLNLFLDGDVVGNNGKCRK